VGETLYLKVIGQSILLHRLFCLVELSLGAWILSGWRPRACASVLAVLFAFFLGAIAIDAFQKTPLPCGCGLLPAGLFRQHPTLVLGAGFFLNLVFMAGTSWLAVAAHEKGSPGPYENTL
jgi:hypothetical protein